jgi:hypothetical protein
MNVMCCPQMVHLFSLAIYVNDKMLVADKENTRYADAVVPITKWESDVRITNIIVKNINSSDIIPPPQQLK